MPAQPIKRVLPKAVNGVGAFVQPCHKIILRYCNWGGSSKGARELLRSNIKEVAAKYPKVQFELVRDSGHPVLKGQYANGKEKVICVKNYDPVKIAEKIHLLTQSSGNQLKKYTVAVESPNGSVRGIWSPFHVDQQYRHKV